MENDEKKETPESLRVFFTRYEPNVWFLEQDVRLYKRVYKTDEKRSDLLKRNSWLFFSRIAITMCDFVIMAVCRLAQIPPEQAKNPKKKKNWSFANSRSTL